MEKKLRVEETVNIPLELIIQIFLRLPVKSLCRFKCVSKFFSSLTKDPNFAVSHVQLSPTRLLYLPHTLHSSHTLSIDLDHHNNNNALPLNPTFLPPSSYCHIKGSCRGFLLLCHSFKHLYLWNPTTNLHKSIPSPPDFDLIRGYEYQPNFYGFCYDPFKDDYLVVVKAKAPFIDKSYSTCFSLKANAWTQIDEQNTPSDLSCRSRMGTLFNDIIHWLAYGYVKDEYVILIFDPIEKSFSDVMVPLPVNVNKPHTVCDLCVLEGCLGLYAAEYNATYIWIMKEYKEQSSWTMSTVLAFDNLPTKSLSPICSTKSGDILGKDCSTGLVRFDVGGMVIEHCSYSDDPHGFNAATYKESLLLFPNVDGGKQ